MSQRVLLFDIESTDLEASFGHCICIGYKYLGEPRTHVMSIYDFPEVTDPNKEPDLYLMKAFHKLITDEADIIISYYGKGFDIKFLNTRMLLAGLPPMPPFGQSHIDLYFCHIEEHRVLTRDLRWVSVGDIKVGDALCGFDSHKGFNDERRFKTTIVENAGRCREQVYRIRLKDGPDLLATAEHPWLAQNGSSAHWLKTKETSPHIKWPNRHGLQPGKTKLIQYINPWKEETSYDAGWLAGILDGEGCLMRHPHGAYRLSVAQNPGVILDRLKSSFVARGLPFATSVNHDCRSIIIKGGWRNTLQLLGSVRPKRLLEKFSPDHIGTLRSSVSGPTTFLVEAVEPAGIKDVVTLATSTHTYLTEGFGSHNTTKFNLKLHSNRLQAVSETLGCPVAKTPVSADKWRKAQRGHMPSVKYVIDHCKKDIEILEWVYLKLRGFIRQHPLIDTLDKCKNCGGHHFQFRGYNTTSKGVKQRRRQCQGCGHWSVVI